MKNFKDPNVKTTPLSFFYASGAGAGGEGVLFFN
jgi:hypothetical protein